VTPEEIEARLDEILEAESWLNLPKSVTSAIKAAYEAAFAEGAMMGVEEVHQALYEAGLLSGQPVGIDFKLTNPRTLAELEEKAALLVRRINDGTRFYLRRMLVKGVEEGLPSEEIASRIRGELETMTPQRVESIVNTEINRAESEGRLKQWDRMGLTRKHWRTYGDACEICRGNEAKGYVEMTHVYEDVFDGTLTPPGHPGVCRCHLEFDEQELMSKAGELTVWEGE
jgi:hypothetical protein